MGLVCEFSFGVTDRAIWAGLAFPIVLVIAVMVAGLAYYLPALRRGAYAEWWFGFRSLGLGWRVSPNDDGLVEDGQRLDEPTIVEIEDEGHVSVPLKEHSAVR